MIIFLHGADSYRSLLKLNEIIVHYKEVRKSGLNLISIDAGQADFAEFFSQLKSASMFAEKKLAVLKNIFSNKQFCEDFLPNIKIMQSLNDVAVVYEGQEADQRLKIFKALAKECKCQEFKMLDARQLRQWIANECELGQIKIAADAKEALARAVGNDLWRLSGEIKKLSDFKMGQVVRREDIDLLVKSRIEVDIFKTIDALGQRDRRQALDYIRKHLDVGESPLYLLSMIAFQFRNLLAVKELAEKRFMYGSIVKKSGLHPFVVKKSYVMCSRFSFEELKNIYRRIFQADLDIKTGRMDSEGALELLASQL